MLFPQVDDTEAPGVLTNLIENRRHNMEEVAISPRRIHEDKEAARQRRNAKMLRPSAGVTFAEGGLILARENDSARFRQEVGPKLVHEN